jgi:hypothetical protein
MLNKGVIFFGYILLITISLCYSEIIKDIRIGRNIIVDDEQNIYTHYDYYSIIKYSPQGKKLLIIGRRGEGPGDIKRIGWFDINPKDSMLYITEAFNGNRRVSIFSPVTGKYIDNWKFEFNWNEWECIPYIQFDNLGNVYIETIKTVWRRYKTYRIGALERAIFKYSYSGEKRKEFYRLKSDFMAEQRGKGNVTMPHCNYLYWSIHDKFLFTRENSKAHISVFDLKGKLVKEIPLPFSIEKFTTKDIDIWEQRIRSDPRLKKGISEGWFDIKFWRRNLQFPKIKSIFGDRMFFDSKGFLYSYKITAESEKVNTWLKTNITSNKSSIINFPVSHRLVCIKNGYCYFSIRPDNDENYPSLLKIEENSIINEFGDINVK